MKLKIKWELKKSDQQENNNIKVEFTLKYERVVKQWFKKSKMNNKTSLTK